jgi:hypothetical protein
MYVNIYYSKTEVTAGVIRLIMASKCTEKRMIQLCLQNISMK